ncbi:acyltransferase domain-containing protein [Streptomyces microflavus]|uniref:type I polyketide synthase n=1 Tax=Streptomyces microflavus TaxID=1919 RepID=UPI002E0E79CC|nr:acyltransferase domain-containing protein [Streptomyces microflavus]
MNFPPVAIVGMACRLPGASDIGQFWHNLCAGTDTISRSQATAPRIGAYGALEDGADFDHRFFGIQPGEAARMDPQHRLFLQTASQALDDAAVDPGRCGLRIGVYAGCDSPADIGGPDETLWDKDFLTSRTAFRLDLRGPAVTVQSACSTSLTAIHLACRALHNGDCDIALAGGARVAADSTGYLHLDGGVFSADGHCRPFDHLASGTVPADGAGVVVLRLLSDAVREGHDIIAVIKGSAINNDGNDKAGFTAPSEAGQLDAILHAWRQAGTAPADLGFIEAHGTGTVLGDPIEVAALARAFADSGHGTVATGPHDTQHTRTTPLCGLGSVKGNIGHTGAASGIASVIKVALMLRHRTQVPTANFTAPNPFLRLDHSPLRIVEHARSWTERLTAGVSGLGMGGTNVHLVLAATPDTAQDAPNAGEADRPVVLCLSAHSPRSLPAYRRSMADALEAAPATLADTAWTLACGRRDRPLRTAIVAQSGRQAAELLRQDQPAVPAEDCPEVVLLFPGQGTWLPGAGAAALDLLPQVAAAASAAAPVLGENGLALRGLGSGTLAQQVNLFVLGYGLARQLQDWGLRPAAALGCSLGEYTAAAAAGLWTFEDGLRVVLARAAAMEQAPPGAMIAVAGQLTEGIDPGVSVAISERTRTILSGSEQDITRQKQRLEATGRACTALATDRAFHSPDMSQPLLRALPAAMNGIACGQLRFPVLSNLEGGFLEPSRAADPKYWIHQGCRTVRLGDNTARLLADGHRVFVELGPGTTMLGALGSDGTSEAVRRIPMIGRAGDDEHHVLLEAIARLWELGAGVDPALLSAGSRRRRHLPGPPFDTTGARGRATAVTSAPRPEPPPSAPDRQRAALAEAWQTILGSEPADTTDFYTAGGDSLGLVHLVGQVRDRLGVQVPIGELGLRPTFGELTRLALDQAAPPTAPAVSPAEELRSESTQVPRGPQAPVLLRRAPAGKRVYFVPAMADSPVTCQRIAQHLDGWDCWALPAPTPAGGRPHTVADRARLHLEQIDTGRPYILAGWSLGAIVAHEMARQAPDQPDVLVEIDGHPAWQRTALLSPEHLAAALPQLRQLRQAARGVRPDPGTRLPADAAQAATAAADLRAALVHVARPVPVPALVIRCGVGPARAARLAARLRHLYPAGLRVAPMPGDHWALLTEPGAATIADLIRTVSPQAIRRTRPGTGTSGSRT